MLEKGKMKSTNKIEKEKKILADRRIRTHSYFLAQQFMHFGLDGVPLGGSFWALPGNPVYPGVQFEVPEVRTTALENPNASPTALDCPKLIYDNLKVSFMT